MGQISVPSREQLHNLLGVWTWNVKANIVVVCADVCDYLNISHDRGIHGIAIERFHAAVHPDDLPGLMQRVEQVLLDGDTFMANYRVISDQHGTIWVRSSGHCFRDASGQATHLSGYITRIDDPEPTRLTEKQTYTQIVKLLQQALELSSQRPEARTLSKLISAVMLEASFQLAQVLKRG